MDGKQTEKFNLSSVYINRYLRFMVNVVSNFEKFTNLYKIIIFSEYLIDHARNNIVLSE